MVWPNHMLPGSNRCSIVTNSPSHLGRLGQGNHGFKQIQAYEVWTGNNIHEMQSPSYGVWTAVILSSSQPADGAPLGIGKSKQIQWTRARCRWDPLSLVSGEDETDQQTFKLLRFGHASDGGGGLTRASVTFIRLCMTIRKP